MYFKERYILEKKIKNLRNEFLQLFVDISQNKFLLLLKKTNNFATYENVCEWNSGLLYFKS